MSRHKTSCDETCQRCGQSNIVWFVDSAKWNLAVSDRALILCPQCFVTAYEEATASLPVWELRIEPVPCANCDGSGRVSSLFQGRMTAFCCDVCDGSGAARPERFDAAR